MKKDCVLSARIESLGSLASPELTSLDLVEALLVAVILDEADLENEIATVERTKTTWNIVLQLKLVRMKRKKRRKDETVTMVFLGMTMILPRPSN